MRRLGILVCLGIVALAARPVAAQTAVQTVTIVVKERYAVTPTPGERIPLTRQGSAAVLEVQSYPTPTRISASLREGHEPFISVGGLDAPVARLDEVDRTIVDDRGHGLAKSMELTYGAGPDLRGHAVVLLTLTD